MPTPRLRLGQLLVDARMVTAAALDEVLVLQRADGRRLGTLLVERGLINETQLTQILSHQLSVPWVSLLHVEFSRQLLNLVPRDVADRFCLVPIYVRHLKNQGDTLYVAMDDPTNDDGLNACREHAGLPVRAMIAPPSDIRGAIHVYYGVPSSGVGDDGDDGDDGDNASKPASSVLPAEAPTKRDPGQASPAPAATVPPETGLAEKPPSPPEAQPDPGAPDAPAVANPPPIKRNAESEEGPQIEAVEIAIPQPRGRAPQMVSLTLLDGTTIRLPARRKRRRVETAVALAQEHQEQELTANPKEETPATTTSGPPSGDGPLHGLTARDLVLALRVVANGADASEVLGEDVRWEALFSALLSLLLKKHLIADWEFVDELKKQV